MHHILSVIQRTAALTWPFIIKWVKTFAMWDSSAFMWLHFLWCLEHLIKSKSKSSKCSLFHVIIHRFRSLLISPPLFTMLSASKLEIWSPFLNKHLNCLVDWLLLQERRQILSQKHHQAGHSNRGLMIQPCSIVYTTSHQQQLYCNLTMPQRLASVLCLLWHWHMTL